MFTCDTTRVALGKGRGAENVQPSHVFMPSSDTSTIKYATTPAGSPADYVHVLHNHETGYINATKSAPLRERRILPL